MRRGGRAHRRVAHRRRQHDGGRRRQRRLRCCCRRRLGAAALRRRHQGGVGPQRRSAAVGALFLGRECRRWGGSRRSHDLHGRGGRGGAGPARACARAGVRGGALPVLHARRQQIQRGGRRDRGDRASGGRVAPRLRHVCARRARPLALLGLRQRRACGRAGAVGAAFDDEHPCAAHAFAGGREGRALGVRAVLACTVGI
mmetsp:Transcript_14603/g.29588  ORF Transcript_14603/g.29588 Transcript_14603/m.29588 type:complete len:200 (+) Transcript_14603:334-933(+)